MQGLLLRPCIYARELYPNSGVSAKKNGVFTVPSENLAWALYWHTKLAYVAGRIHSFATKTKALVRKIPPATQANTKCEQSLQA